MYPKTMSLSTDTTERTVPLPTGMSQIQLILVYSIAVIYAVALTYVSGDDIILQKRSERNRIDTDRFMEDDPRRKRPFCNAFTGCGRKRSDDSMTNLVELNPDPAVEELSRQVLSEAKLWEALQEARAEFQRGRNQGVNMIPREIPIPLTMAGYRRKRSSTTNENQNSTSNTELKRNQKR